MFRLLLQILTYFYTILFYSCDYTIIITFKKKIPNKPLFWQAPHKEKDGSIKEGSEMQLYTAALKCMIRDTSEKTMYYLIISSKVSWEVHLLK